MALKKEITIISANIDFVKDSKYPLHYTLDLIHSGTIFPQKNILAIPPGEETIYFNITRKAYDMIARLLLKHDEDFIATFQTEQSSWYYSVRWVTSEIVSFSSPVKEYLFSAAEMKSLFPMSKQQAEVGDTIKYGKTEFVVMKVFPSGDIHVFNEDVGYRLLASNDYSVMSRGVNINQNCPECKGTGKILLFNFDSPCSLCNKTKECI